MINTVIYTPPSEAAAGMATMPYRVRPVGCFSSTCQLPRPPPSDPTNDAYTLTIHYPALTVSISDSGFPTSIAQGTSGTVTLARNTNRGTLQVYVRVTSTSFMGDDALIFGTSFANGSGTAMVTIDLSTVTSLTADETATLQVLTPTEAAGQTPPPDTYAVGTGMGLSRRTFTLAHAAAPNTPPTLMSVTTTEGTLVESGVAADGTNPIAADTNANGSLSATDTEEDDTTLIYQVDDGGTWESGGSASVDGTYGTLVLEANGNWTYTLTDTSAATNALHPGNDGTETFSFRADDGTTATSGATSRYSDPQTLTLTITGSNDAPTTDDGTLTGINEDQNHTFATGDFTFMDVDANHAALHSVSFTQLPEIMGMSGVSAGVLHNTNTGTDLAANATVMEGDLDDIEYRPVNRSATYTAEIGFTVSDGAASSAASTLSIQVTADNDDPMLTTAGTNLTNLTYQTGADIGAALGAGYAASLFEAVDADDTLAYTITTFEDTGGNAVGSPWLTLAPATGTFTGTAPAVTTGSPFSITVTATATPSGSETLDKTFTITLSSQVQQPIVAADTVTITEADALAIRGDGSGGVMGNAKDGGAATATPNSVTPGGALARDNLNGNTSATVRRYEAGNAITTSARTAGSGGAQGIAETPTVRGVTASFSMADNGDFVFDVTSAASTVDALPMGTDAVFVFSYDLEGSDSSGTYNSGTITFTVTGQNDAPVAASPLPTATPAALGTAYSLPLAQFFRDPDTGDSVVSFRLDGACTGFSVNGANLVGSNSGSLPSSGVTMPTTTCMVIGNDGDADSAAAVPIAITVTATAPTTPTVTITTFPSALADNANLEVALTRIGGNTAAPLAVGYSYQVASNTTVYGAATFGASSATANITVTAATLGADDGETVTFTLLNPTDSAAQSLTVGAYDIPSSGNGLTRMVTVTAATPTTPPMTDEAQMRVERNRDTQQVATEFARTLSLGAVNTVRQRTLSLGPRSPRAQQSQSSVDVDVTGLLDFAMSRAGVDAPSSGQLLQSLGSSGGGMSGAVMDYAENYAMSRAQQVAAETSPFVNDAQALETERFVGGLGDGALGDPAAGSAAYADLASLGEGLVSSAAGRGGSGWTDGSMRFWASAEYGEISSSPRTGVSFDDDTTTISLGMERHFGGNKLLGVAASWLKGEPEFTAAGGVRGKAELEQWSLSPYIAYSFGSSRVWATVGVGVGSMDYSDNRSMGTGVASSDTTSVLYAVGAEQDIAELGGVDLLARVEAAGANVHLSRGDNLYDAQDVDSAGVRAELEAGYSVVAGDGHYRPYVTVGYRADGGDSSSDDAVEYGGGLLVGTGHLTVIASARGQSSTGGGSDDRTSYSLELAYDRDRDRRGLNLSVRNSIGDVDSGVWADSYDYGSPSSPSMRGLMNMRAGYGHEIGNWLLTPYVESDLDNGDMARWSMGLGADFGTGVVELTHTARPGQSAAPAESMLQLRLEFR